MYYVWILPPPHSMINPGCDIDRQNIVFTKTIRKLYIGLQELDAKKKKLNLVTYNMCRVNIGKLVVDTTKIRYRKSRRKL